MGTEHGWGIAGKFGLYVGWWMTRNAAIRDHVAEKLGVGEKYGMLTDAQRDAWNGCKKAGDRAVKIQISYRD